MDDLISRQDAINEFSYCQTYLFDSIDRDPKISLEDAKYAIEQLPSAQQWIPWVDNDDRLKNHYYYLVTHVGIEIPMLAKFHDDGCYFEIISMYQHKSVYVWENDIITAWMPLPEIYKGEE